VRYAYMDCRRAAQRRGLVIRGPRKIYDSSIAHIGFLWAKRIGRPLSVVGEKRSIPATIAACGAQERTE